ncbi:MAG: hypothetical protein AMK72_01625 [Planctomycetes bacterium SM23_25]|nr:MAG: hypothetical protein AMK72_01625 [Planctomycetes bacterium SM23_25]
MERVCIFVDGSNLYHGAKALLPDGRIDIQKLITWLCGERQLLRAYYYNVPMPPTPDPTASKAQQRFFDALAHIDYLEVRLGRLEPRGETLVEKGVDVQIAVDMLEMAVRNVYDTAILVSSDGDFAKAIEAVKGWGKHVEVAHFERAYRVKQAADKTIELNEETLKPLLR